MSNIGPKNIIDEESERGFSNRRARPVMMIGGGVATPPGTAKTVAAINNEMVVDSVGSGSVSGSASGSGSPATGSTRTTNNNNNSTNNNNNNDTSNNNNNNDGHVIVVGGGATTVTANAVSSGGKICCRDEEASPGTGTTVTRPWEPPSPTLAQSRARVLQVHPSHHHSQQHASHPAHHHQQIALPAAQLIEGKFQAF